MAATHAQHASFASENDLATSEHDLRSCGTPSAKGGRGAQCAPLRQEAVMPARRGRRPRRPAPSVNLHAAGALLGRKPGTKNFLVIGFTQPNDGMRHPTEAEAFQSCRRDEHACPLWVLLVRSAMGGQFAGGKSSMAVVSSAFGSFARANDACSASADEQCSSLRRFC